MEVVADYDADLFVIPRQVHRWLLSRVRQWQRGHTAGFPGAMIWGARHRSPTVAAGDQVLSLIGERGIGKTWLLRYLAEHEQRTSPEAVYLDLERRTEFLTPRAYVEAVEDQIRQRCEGGKGILLLDTVPPYLDAHLRVLEDTILRPHLTRHSSLVIMALLHPSQVCWRSPALRGGEVYSLSLFEEQQTRDQLRRLDKIGAVGAQLDAAGVQQHSGGLPLLTYLLATREPAAAYELLLDHWFSRIPIEDYGRVRCCLEAVCALDVLEHVCIEQALEVYNRYWSDAGGDPMHPGGIRNVLGKYWLARPSPGSPGRVVLVESVRRATCELLRMRDAELYALLNEVAQAACGGQR